MGSESPGESLEFPGRTLESGASRTQGEGLRVTWSPGAQGQVIVPGAAAGAAAGPAGPAGCPARAPGSAGKGLLNVAATAHASGRRTGLPAAVSTLPGAEGPVGGGGGRQEAPGKLSRQPPTPCTRFTGPPPPLPAGLPAPPHSWPRWEANPGCGLRQLGICLSWGERGHERDPTQLRGVLPPPPQAPDPLSPTLSRPPR